MHRPSLSFSYASAAAGVRSCVKFVIALLLLLHSAQMRESHLKLAAWGLCQAVARTVAVVGMAVAVFWTAERFAAEPLLACVLAGVIATNRKCAALPYADSWSSDVMCSC